jgi:hypothetical protein
MNKRFGKMFFVVNMVVWRLATRCWGKGLGRGLRRYGGRIFVQLGQTSITIGLFKGLSKNWGMALLQIFGVIGG